MKNSITVILNGKTEEIFGENAFLHLADYLRKVKLEKGTKVVCSEGDCGACTVFLKMPFESIFKSVNSCIIPMYQLEQCEILTFDGFENSEDPIFNKILSDFFEKLGTQCGFCTPGFVMQLRAIYANRHFQNSHDIEQTLNHGLSGNLCRCTGYLAIREIAQDLFEKRGDHQNTKGEELVINPQQQAAREYANCLVKSKDHEVFVATTLDAALDYKSNHPEAKVVAGATDLAVQWNKGVQKPRYILSLTLVPELHKIKIESSHFVEIGAQVNLNTLINGLEQKQIKALMNFFASDQIKNMGTLAGNIINASPIGDTLPFLYALNAEVVLASTKGVRHVPLNRFILGYRKTDLQNTEILTQVKFELPSENDYLCLKKISRRKFLDISSVTFAGRVKLNGDTIEDLNFIFGGVGPTLIELKEISKNIKGQQWNRSVFADQLAQIPTFLQARTDLRATAAFREKMAKNLFLNFFDEIEQQRSIL